MLEQLLTEREVMRSVAEASFNSPLNRRYNLKEIVANEEPQTWQRLADELADPIQRYIKQEYDKDVYVSPVVPSNDAVFSCIQTLPYFMFNPHGSLLGIRMGKVEWTWTYITATYNDVLNVFKYRKHNREHPDDKVPYFFITSEVSKAKNSGGNEMVNIQVIPNYHVFVYTVAHEVGHTLGNSLKVKRKDDGNFASTFGMRFMEWYMSQELSPPPSLK